MKQTRLRMPNKMVINTLAKIALVNKSILIFLFLMLLFSTIQTFAQGCTALLKWETKTAPSDNVERYISSCIWASQYNIINSVTSGETYNFRSSNVNDYLTLTDTFNTVLITGITPISWTATFNGNVRLHVHTNSSCGTEFSCRTTYIQCTSCPTPGPGCIGTPSGISITAPQQDTTEIRISDFNFAGDFNIIDSIVNGETYQFRSSNVTDYLTLTDGSNNVLIYGKTPINWTATFSGTIRLHVHTGISCGTQITGRETYIKCTSCCRPSFEPDFITITSNPICKDTFTTLSISGGTLGINASWNWYRNSCGGEFIEKASSISVAPANTTTYFVRAEGCDTTNCVQATVNVFSLPVADFAAENVCFNDPVQFNDLSYFNNGAIVDYQWYFGDDNNTTSNEKNPSHIYDKPCINEVMLVVTSSDGCIDSTKEQITVYFLPEVKASPEDTSIYKGQSIILNASGANNYEWTPAQWLSATDISKPEASPEATITYTVTGTDSIGCQFSDDITVVVTEGFKVFMPNIFTPNNDGINDFIFVDGWMIKEIELYIYNRWGELIFSTKGTPPSAANASIIEKWDGTYKGEDQKTGNYGYYLRVISEKSEEHIERGTITLIR